MESKIDLLLKHDDVRKTIEKNVSSISNDLTLTSMITRVEKIINQKIDSIESIVIQY